LLVHVNILELRQGSRDWVSRLSLLHRLLWLLSVGIWRRHRQNILTDTKGQAGIGIDRFRAGGPFLEQIPSLRLTVGAVGLRPTHGAG
jgi:hypothetical protein